MSKLTFKQYLDSKDLLREAINNVPVSVSEYEITHYCSLSVGEYEEDKQDISMKPKQRVIVEWRHDDLDNPTPVSIVVKGHTVLDETEKYQTFWSDIKFNKWIKRHTRGIK